MSNIKIERSPNLIKFREEEKENPAELIKFLSTVRHEQLTTFCSHNIDQMKALEQKFGKYLFVPLALPMFEFPEKEHFFHWWNTHAIRPQKTVSEHLSPETGYSSAESVDLIEKVKHYWTPNMQTDSFIKEFPKLWQQFNDLLPIDNILPLHLWSSYKPFTEHRDPGEVIDMPISFRIKLYDENPEETLYFFDNPTQPHVYGEDTIVPTAPNTNSWVWNNLRIKHGSVYNSEYKKILVIATGVINAERYEELMDTSISTYKDRCVLSKYSLENYVDV